MADLSNLDEKYFIDRYVYNCPFCNRRNVNFHILCNFTFDWSENKKCYVYIVRCSSCNHDSMHLSYESIGTKTAIDKHMMFNIDINDIDRKIFYSVPTSYFVVDERIPKELRELIIEADGCLKMNYLTGASACTRKAIYEFLIIGNATGETYEQKIKSLKEKYKDVDSMYFDILSHIQKMTSDKIHEDSWDEWDSKHLKLIMETLKSVFKDIFVLPAEKKERAEKIRDLQAIMNKPK